MYIKMQGILKLGKAREEKLSRVTLKVDEADITFALQVQIYVFALFSDLVSWRHLLIIVV